MIGSTSFYGFIIILVIKKSSLFKPWFSCGLGQPFSF
ncbi:hypothetical protein SLEP1_g19600 [Rubroshorea leprosula]|uniref:Uncharacterized protein n=1 Tax=Rubroshorea leprosula TaxID=152421 RepID=A0AAV5J959_9ROSI|nr:hypothetical protein SLEP1_g19600 [Rubroshorea leprosula]